MFPKTKSISSIISSLFDLKLKLLLLFKYYTVVDKNKIYILEKLFDFMICALQYRNIQISVNIRNICKYVIKLTSSLFPPCVNINVDEGYLKLTVWVKNTTFTVHITWLHPALVMPLAHILHAVIHIIISGGLPLKKQKFPKYLVSI